MKTSKMTVYKYSMRFRTARLRGRRPTSGGGSGGGGGDNSRQHHVMLHRQFERNIYTEDTMLYID
jgi:hypothetical protein